jgi:hypothetical protein
MGGKRKKFVTVSEQALETHRKSVESAAESIIERYQGTLEKIQSLRSLVNEVDSELSWFRDREPDMLDALRARMLEQFASDGKRRWSTTDYGILLDKARLMRGESSMNLSSLMSVVMQAEAAEAARLSADRPKELVDGEEVSG